MASASRMWSIPLPNGSRISVLLSLPFALVHIASLLIFFIPFHWYYLVTCLALLFVRMFSSPLDITAIFRTGLLRRAACFSL